MAYIVDNLIKADEVTSEELYNYLFPEKVRLAVRNFVYDEEDRKEVTSDSFDTFLADQYSLFRLYIRVTPIDFPHPLYEGKPMLVIANVFVDGDLQKRGVFKRTLKFLEDINPYPGLMVECVGNQYLKAYVEKQGYHLIKGYYRSPSFFKEQ